MLSEIHLHAKKNHVFLFCWSLLLFHFICTNLHFKKRWLPGQGQSPAIDKLIQLLIILSYIAVFVCPIQGLTFYKNWQNFFPDKYQRIFYNIHPWCIIMCHKLKVSIWFQYHCFFHFLIFDLHLTFSDLQWPLLTSNDKNFANNWTLQFRSFPTIPIFLTFFSFDFWPPFDL